MRIRAIVRALGLAAALALSVVATQPLPLAAQTLEVQKVAEGVWAAAPAKGANVGWFLLGDGVVAVDAGTDAATAAEVLKKIAETTGGKPVRLLVLTHNHADHSGGARAFVAAGARVLCQEAIAGQTLAFLTQPSSDPSDPLAGKSGVRPLVESISERAIFVDGVHNAQIYFLGTAHTAGDLVVYLPGEKVLFSGDLALGGRQPYMQSPDVDPAGWERALQGLSRVPVEKLVPGHGEIGPVTGLADSLAYVSRVHALAKKLVQSGLADDMLDAAIRNPENAIQNVEPSPSHLANVKASVKAVREKSKPKTTPPAPTPAAK